MAGPLDIQRYPMGVVDLLGMKSTGDTPHVLDQAVRLNLDALDYYLWPRKVSFTGQSSSNATAVGQIMDFLGIPLVPAGQLWAVYSVNLWWGPEPAGANITAVPYYDFQNTTGRVFFDPVVGNIAAWGAGGKVFEKPHLVGPGSKFRAYVLAITGAPNIPVTLDLTYAVLSI